MLVREVEFKIPLGIAEESPRGDVPDRAFKWGSCDLGENGQYMVNVSALVVTYVHIHCFVITVCQFTVSYLISNRVV